MSKEEKTVTPEEMMQNIEKAHDMVDKQLQRQAENLVSTGLPIITSALIDGDIAVIVSPRMYDKIKKIRGE